jgi:hypothetical protein
MKKLLMVVALFGFCGLVTGCGEGDKKPDKPKDTKPAGGDAKKGAEETK